MNKGIICLLFRYCISPFLENSNNCIANAKVAAICVKQLNDFGEDAVILKKTKSKEQIILKQITNKNDHSEAFIPYRGYNGEYLLIIQVRECMKFCHNGK